VKLCRTGKWINLAEEKLLKSMQIKLQPHISLSKNKQSAYSFFLVKSYYVDSAWRNNKMGS
jgi:hypothetical protein